MHLFAFLVLLFFTFMWHALVVLPWTRKEKCKGGEQSLARVVMSGDEERRSRGSRVRTWLDDWKTQGYKKNAS
jgi:hypothetical protein